MQTPDPLLTGAATIRGDLRDLMLRNLAGQTKLWKDMPQSEQAQVAAQVEAMCGALVTQIAVLTATGGRPAVLATLENISIGAECRAVLSVPKDQAGHLIPSAKQIVAVMQPSAAAFMGERAPAKTMPDQLSLVDTPAAPQAAPPLEIISAIEALCGTSAERCIPETETTLKLQQKALVEGRRACQMFPTGTKELPLPDGMERIKTERGVFHFNPDEMDAVSIVAASNSGEENLVLGLGPYSKAEIMKLAANGEKVVCVVERTQGHPCEVLTALTVERFVDEVKEIMEAHAAPEHFVSVMSVEDVINRRMGADKPIEIVVGSGGAGGATTSRPGRKKAQPKRKPGRPKKAASPKPNGHAPEPQSAAPPAKRTGSPFA